MGANTTEKKTKIILKYKNMTIKIQKESEMIETCNPGCRKNRKKWKFLKKI